MRKQTIKKGHSKEKMIEDKEMGLKVAENEEEVLWNTLKTEAESLIKHSENNIKVQKAMLEVAITKLEELKCHSKK